MTRKGWVWAALGGGAAVFCGLIAREGAGEVLAAFVAVGWGIAAVAAWQVGIVAVNAVGWAVLIPRAMRPSPVIVLWMRWLAASVNQMLPVAQVGGEMLRARLLTRSGVPGAIAGAGVIADMTAGLATQGVFAGFGVALLLLNGDGTGGLPVAASLGALAALLALFYWAQRGGGFERFAHHVERFAGPRDLTRLTGGAAALDAALRDIYGRPAGFLTCCLWRLTAWGLFAMETWLVLWFLDHPVALGDAIAIEGLAQVVRTVGFIVPGALGVQEAGYLALGALVGVPPETALALSLVKRARDVILGVPGLAAWQIHELLRLRRAGPVG
ncbi:MAG: flippase-like domain-containing protein [Rhodospirillales bacterium]|nr:flippase-like domain-containing protein [Rhodospirillales bacterium]